MTRTHEKMTHKEHALRAQLLGLLYDWRDGTYCDGTIETGGPGYNKRIMACDTLEVIYRKEAEDRAREIGHDIYNSDVKWHTPLNETPWARMDNDDEL